MQICDRHPPNIPASSPKQQSSPSFLHVSSSFGVLSRPRLLPFPRPPPCVLNPPQLYLACSYAIDSFFLLSGFFAALSFVRLLDAQRRQKSLLQLAWFWVYRLGRILPAFYVSRFPDSCPAKASIDLPRRSQPFVAVC